MEYIGICRRSRSKELVEELSIWPPMDVKANIPLATRIIILKLDFWRSSFRGEGGCRLGGSFTRPC